MGSWILHKDRLLQTPHSAWYYKGYDEYNVNSKAVNTLMDISKEGISIKIVMGTWCPDSRREVPRFMKILDQWQFPLTKVTFIGVDNANLHRLVNMRSWISSVCLHLLFIKIILKPDASLKIL